MKVILVKRDSQELFYKFSHDEDEFKEVDFVPSAENAENLFPSAIAPAHGTNENIKEQILKLLVPHMPPRKTSLNCCVFEQSEFWSLMMTSHRILHNVPRHVSAWEC